ncbi:MAG: HD-GYP domain-containing protein [Coriobacteriia bacterium]
MHRYTALLALTALGVSVWAVHVYPIEDWLPVVALVLLNFVVENFSFRLPVAGSVSLSFAIGYAALIHSGPLAGIACALAASTNLQEIREGKPLVLLVFNASQLSLAIASAGIAYQAMGGRVLVGGSGAAASIVPALAAALVFYAANVLLVGYGASVLKGQVVSEVLREQRFLSYGVSLLVLAFLGLLVAYLLADRSWAGLSLLVLPFMAARRTFRVYVELTEAYTSTVRSLVAAIEVKDPYTRGHSERVAVYAKRLAERIGTGRSDLELLERAALLHDVGKIGVDSATLASPTQLTAEEVNMIRQHPVLGSQLASQVEFLEDVVPIIRHHHERFDGAGYPDGLVGAAIPELSRILAVADSYDAMTSDRAYRLGMTRADAALEILKVAGKQLDPALSVAFVSVIGEEAEAGEL